MDEEWLIMLRLRNYLQTTNELTAPCGHSFFKIVKHGLRYNKKVNAQRYMCIQCGKYFSFGPQKKKKLTYEVWKFISDCNLNKMSLRAIKKAVELEFKLNISHKTVNDWLNIKPEFFKSNPLETKIIEYQKQKLLIKIEVEKKLLLNYEKKKEEIIYRIPRLQRKIDEINKRIKNLQTSGL